MSIEQEIRTIKQLKAEKAYIHSDYLKAFSDQFRAVLIKEYPDALNSTVPIYKNGKTVSCKCVKCSTIYPSEQTAEEMGMCQACHMRLSDECLTMSPPEDYMMKKGKKKPKKIFPHHLGKDNIFAIRKFFCDNMNVKFKMKKHAPEAIREHFVCAAGLSDAQIFSMLNINSLRDIGLIYKL